MTTGFSSALSQAQASGALRDSDFFLGDFEIVLHHARKETANFPLPHVKPAQSWKQMQVQYDATQPDLTGNTRCCLPGDVCVGLWRCDASKNKQTNKQNLDIGSRANYGGVVRQL